MSELDRMVLSHPVCRLAAAHLGALGEARLGNCPLADLVVAHLESKPQRQGAEGRRDETLLDQASHLLEATPARCALWLAGERAEALRRLEAEPQNRRQVLAEVLEQLELDLRSLPPERAAKKLAGRLADNLRSECPDLAL